MKQNQKPCTMTKKVIDTGKRRKTLHEVKPVENTSNNPLSFLEISPMQKKDLLSHKLQDSESIESFRSVSQNKNVSRV